jgi:glycosyltransferase involved in cell wall biosynthesis
VRAAIVPALNEEHSVADVVRSARTYVDVVIVIDDGSTDGTADAAREAGAVVVSHPQNRGVGAAIATGLRTAVERGADVVIQVDGDDQHDASFVPLLLEEVERGVDLVVGTRFESGFEMSWLRRVVLRACALLISRTVGVAISDPTSGFRAFSRAAAEGLAPVFPTKYLSDTVEVLYLAHEQELVLATVPVKMRPRSGGTPSVGVVRGVLYTLRILGIIAVHSTRRRRPRAVAEPGRGGRGSGG